MNTSDILIALKLSKKGQLKYRSSSRISDILGETRECDGVIGNHGSFNRDSSPMNSPNRSIGETAIELEPITRGPDKNYSNSLSSPKRHVSNNSKAPATTYPGFSCDFNEKQPINIQSLRNMSLNASQDESCGDLEQYTRFKQLKAKIEARHRRRTFDMKLKQINDEFEKEILLLDDKIINYHTSKYEDIEKSLSNNLTEENQRLEELKASHGMRKEHAKTTMQRVAAVKCEMIEAEERAIAEEKARTSLLKDMSLICKEGLNERVKLIEKIKTSKYTKLIPKEVLVEMKNNLISFEKCVTGTSLNEKNIAELKSYFGTIKQVTNGIKMIYIKIEGILDAAEKEEMKAKAEEVAKNATATTTNATVTTQVNAKGNSTSQTQSIASGVFGSAYGIQTYETANKFLVSHQQPFCGISTSSDTVKRQYRHQLLKVVNTPINAISNESPSHLADKMKRLKSVLEGQMIVLAGKQVSINDQPEGKAMAYDFIAQKLVLQGAQQVSSNHKSAFAVATVALFLWSEFPEFGDVLLSHFYKRCPLLVPYYVPRLENQSKEEYFSLLGYDVTNGEIEEEDKYLKKLSGLVRLYGAILHSPVPPGVRNQAHPHGIQFAWFWLASILNLQPRPTITATILFDFLEVCGYSLMEKFKKQFQKLLHVLCKDFIPKIDAVTPADQKGPVSRLKDFLEKGIKNGAFPPPDGQLTPLWWRS